MKLHHPFWTHAGALLLLAVVAGVLFASLSAEGEFPIHWGADGPNDWAAAWAYPLALLFAGTLLLTISIAWDGFWARTFKGRFNPLSLLDELAIGWLTTAALAHLCRVEGWPIPPRWQLVAAVWGLVLPLAVVLELRRPAPQDEPLTSEAGDAADLAQRVAEPRRSGQAWAYCESQNPGWLRWGMPPFAVGCAMVGVSELLARRPLGALLLSLGLLSIATCAGGVRISVTPEGFRLRAGYFGLPLLRLQLDKIASADVLSISPPFDFGGYGIRANWANWLMRGYFVEGDRGVTLTTTAGRRYLVGSNTPDRLLAVIRAAKG